MPQSLSQILVHLVYSTKGRHPWLEEETQHRLHAYLSRVLAGQGNVPLIVGGHTDHVHMLFGLSRTKTIAQVVESTKTSSSKWLKDEFTVLKEFGWQIGYGAFSVSPDDQNAIISYIANQRVHHNGLTFQEEYRGLLEKHRIAYDERYVWD